jgi:hypothetical protein
MADPPSIVISVFDIIKLVLDMLYQRRPSSHHLLCRLHPFHPFLIWRGFIRVRINIAVISSTAMVWFPRVSVVLETRLLSRVALSMWRARFKLHTCPSRVCKRRFFSLDRISVHCTLLHIAEEERKEVSGCKFQQIHSHDR